MNSIDELIREGLTVPICDGVEASSLEHARAALSAAIAAEAVPDRGRVWGQRLRFGIGLVPVVTVGLLVLMISAGAVLFIHGRPSSRSGVAHRPSASALVSRLAVLARPQTAADRLPVKVTDRWAQLSSETQAGRLYPQLTRLVAAQNTVKIYLAVVAPVSDPYSPWTAADGDQVTLIEVGPTGAGATQAIPANALSDADIVSFLTPPGSFSQAVAADVAFSVSIVPNGVSRASWYYTANGQDTRISLPVHNNVLVSTFAARDGAGKVSATWFAANGERISTNDNLVKEAQVASQSRRYRQDLLIAETQNHTASPQLLKAFAVFSFHSPAGTRLPNGLVISKPRLDQLPLGVLSFAESGPGRRFAFDLREVRRVQASSGLSMYILPGTSSLCVAQTGVFEIYDSPAQAAGAGFGCTQNLGSALLHGSGIISGNAKHQTSYGVVPTAHPNTTLSIKGGRSKTFRPTEGVYIEPS